jgi:L-2-hydroxyglutarate oxidase LhgO
MRHNSDGWTLQATSGDYGARFLVTCGGLYADRLCRAAGGQPPARIVPFRGEYYMLGNGRDRLVRHLIYPVPDPGFPFLGVHFTRMIHGGVEAGPNAVLALAREGYTKARIHLGELAESLAYPGLWRFARRHTGMAWSELRRSFSRQLFAASLRRLVPAVTAEDLVPGGAGVRAQAMLPDGTFVEDFLFADGEQAVHVLNAPSPGATASLAIGDEVAGRVLARLAS